jgi:hypothetical protein
VNLIPPGIQRFALAVVAALILAMEAFRPGSRAVTAHAREITAALHDAAAGACTLAAAVLLVLAARSVITYRGEHALPPRAAPEPVPAPAPAREKTKGPARDGEPAYTYWLSEPGTASRPAQQPETVGVNPWPDRENL